MVDPIKIFEDFRSEAQAYLSEREVYDLMDRTRNDCLEELLIEKGLITQHEMDIITAKKLLNILEFLKKKGVISPIQREDIR